MSGTDTFWKSDTVRSGLGALVGVGFVGLLTVLTWNIAQTYELKTEAAVKANAIERLTSDVEEIKRDVKTLLERK